MRESEKKWRSANVWRKREKFIFDWSQVFSSQFWVESFVLGRLTTSERTPHYESKQKRHNNNNNDNNNEIFGSAFHLLFCLQLFTKIRKYFWLKIHTFWWLHWNKWFRVCDTLPKLFILRQFFHPWLLPSVQGLSYDLQRKTTFWYNRKCTNEGRRWRQFKPVFDHNLHARESFCDDV